jgi:hypothetical protein
VLQPGQGVYLGEAPDGVLSADGGERVRYICAGGHLPGTHHH